MGKGGEKQHMRDLILDDTGVQVDGNARQTQFVQGAFDFGQVMGIILSKVKLVGMSECCSGQKGRRIRPGCGKDSTSIYGDRGRAV